MRSYGRSKGRFKLSRVLRKCQDKMKKQEEVHFLELFAGTRSIGKEADKVGFRVNSVEIDPKFSSSCNMIMDVLDFDPNEYAKKHGVPDALWASPVCTSFSIAGIRHHRIGTMPISETAQLGNRLLFKTLSIITEFLKMNPKMVWWIENPRGMMRKMECMQGLPRFTLTYCQYGHFSQKPTDIWTNCAYFRPLPVCKRGSKCHVSAPRGSSKGIQSLPSSHPSRSVIPPTLCREVIESTYSQIHNHP